MSNCYWHQKLTEESLFLCVFNSPFGRYRFKRMLFGISCASEVAQKMVGKHFGDISGALPIFDDIIIGGRDEQEHDLILRKVLTRARKRNIRFSRDKIQFLVNKVKYWDFHQTQTKFLLFTTCPLQHANKICKGYWA